ncbi:hypothetical protein DDE82_000410 [Stemphylium lycopersici]|nr:hypothetical protein TW65_08841 [Stemphylium lycopersici]RAR12070.1 hypothetical protein DDE82_000410 [Stemphylium lycopersici]
MAPPVDAEAFLSSLETIECSICTEAFDSEHPPVITEGCRHIFGEQCLKQWVASENLTHDKCPICRHPLFGDSTRMPPGFGQQRVQQAQLQPPSSSRAASTQIPRTPTVITNRTLAHSMANQPPLQRNLLNSMLSHMPDYSNLILRFLPLNGSLERPPNARAGNRLQRNNVLHSCNDDEDLLSRIRQRVSQSTVDDASLARSSGNRARRDANSDPNVPARPRRADNARRDGNPVERDGRVARRLNHQPGERRTHQSHSPSPVGSMYFGYHFAYQNGAGFRIGEDVNGPFFPRSPPREHNLGLGRAYRSGPYGSAALNALYEGRRM